MCYCFVSIAVLEGARISCIRISCMCICIIFIGGCLHVISYWRVLLSFLALVSLTGGCCGPRYCCLESLDGELSVWPQAKAVPLDGLVVCLLLLCMFSCLPMRVYYVYVLLLLLPLVGSYLVYVGVVLMLLYVWFMFVR